MELRKKEEAREIDTTKMILRQAGNVVIYRRGAYRKSDRKSGIDHSIHKRAAVRQEISKGGIKTPPVIHLNAQQKKKWDSYSPAQQKKVLAKAEKAVKKRTLYGDKAGKAAAKTDESFDYTWYRQPEKSKTERNTVNAGRVQQEKTWKVASLVLPKSAMKKELRAVRSGPAVKKVTLKNGSGIRLEKAVQTIPRYQLLHWKRATASKDKAAPVKNADTQKNADIRRHRSKEKQKEAEKNRKVKKSQKQNESQGHTKEIRHARYEEKRVQKELRKQNRLYVAHLVGTIEADLRRDGWIKEQQMQGYMEMNHAELERRTRAAAIRTVVLPIRVQIALLRTKVASALVHAGMVVLKYVAATAIPILAAVVFFLFAASLFSGIAGEEEQLGYASSGYEIVAYAEEWIGVTKYIWGAGRDSATSWQDYADCSSFVHGIFAHFGYEIGYDTYAQEHAGTVVSGGLDEALPGDIILFFSGSIGSGMSSHVGIYAGEGRIIHCSGGRSNVSPETAGRGVCWGSPTADGRPFQVRRIVEWTAVGDVGNATSGHRKDTTSYTQSQMELIWAIVAQEDNGSYAGALAVISSAMNRTESASWRYCGSNSLAQLTAPGQYCYSIDNYWRARLNGNVPSYVKQAVSDCLQRGIRNHSFTSFRSTKGSVTGPNAVQIGGNWYFGS